MTGASQLFRNDSQIRWLAVSAVVSASAAGALLLISGIVSFLQLAGAAVALIGVVVLAIFPEIALASLLMVGSIKAMPQLAGSPLDLTVALAIIVILGAALQSGKDFFSLRILYPKSYMLYLPFFAIMLISLMYTSNFATGIDKVGRFVVFSGIAVLAPFLVIKSSAALRRFFLAQAVLGLVVALDSFAGLGGNARLVAEGGDTIQLGHDASLAIVVIWYLLLPQRSFVGRLALYAIVVTLGVAAIGAGSRGPVVALVFCLALSVVLHKDLGIKLSALLTDFGLLILVGLLVVPVVGIPQSSYDYLARLGDSNMHTMLGPREALMAEAWRLIMAHPLRGIGIGGFPVVFRGIGAWPHNMFLEIGAEMGVFAVLLFVLLLGSGLHEILKQVGNSGPIFGPLTATVLAFYSFEFIDVMNTGSLNDHRAMWLAIALPFVLTTLRVREQPPLFFAERFSATAYEGSLYPASSLGK